MNRSWMVVLSSRLFMIVKNGFMPTLTADHMDLVRIIQIYGIYGFIACLFLFLGWKVYHRNKKQRVNQMFSLCFFTTGGGLLVNLIYAPMEDPALFPIVIFLNILTNFGACLGLGFLLVGTLIVYRSNSAVPDRLKLAIVVIYAAVLVGLFIIPGGATINPDFTITWSVPFTIYGLVASQTVFAATIGLAIGSYNDFEDAAVKRKFKQFILGLILLDYILVQNYLVNAGIIARNLILTVISLVVIPAAILLYNGIGKHT